MKSIIASLLAFVPLLSFAQYEDVAPGWEKEKYRELIISKMDELINEVSFEYNCDKSQITYLVTEKHKFYQMKKDDLHFPKYVTIKACDETYYYECECLQNAYGKPKEWVKGKWVLLPSNEESEVDDE
ncbi:MAG: hypothetical protein HKN45_09615 [Flavobacteriales bacterium]|nr:hypothetical protein [Flavobacteriales bacterium]